MAGIEFNITFFYIIYCLRNFSSLPNLIACHVSCALFRPGRLGPNASGRGVLSMQGLSYGVVRVDTPNSLTSLTLQDCGQVLPGGMDCMCMTKVAYDASLIVTFVGFQHCCGLS